MHPLFDRFSHIVWTLEFRAVGGPGGWGEYHARVGCGMNVDVIEEWVSVTEGVDWLGEAVRWSVA